MSRSAYTTRTRLWVLLTLLAYAGQLLGISAHASVAPRPTVDATALPVPASQKQVDQTNANKQTSEHSSHCHGQSKQVINTEITLNDTNKPTQQNPASQSCCDDNCQMSGCHGASAAINSIYLSTYSTQNILANGICANAPCKPVSSLYRPPNLA